jgi:hypothetical protein
LRLPGNVGHGAIARLVECPRRNAANAVDPREVAEAKSSLLAPRLKPVLRRDDALRAQIVEQLFVQPGERGSGTGFCSSEPISRLSSTRYSSEMPVAAASAASFCGAKGAVELREGFDLFGGERLKMAVDSVVQQTPPG